MTPVDERARRDDDRLPWLESAEEVRPTGPSALRIVLFVLLGLLLVGAILFGVSRWQRGGVGGTGEGNLIKAPTTAYKVRPREPGGMKVEGEGDTVFATSEGGATPGAVDTRAVPEAPVVSTATPVAPSPATPAPTTSRVVAEVPASRGRLSARAPGAVATTRTAPSGGGAVVQLGSFPTRAGADSAWAQLSKRFGYLAGLGKTVEAAEVNGRTTYRLRVNAGSAGAASDLCARLKVAGEPCFVAG